MLNFFLLFFSLLLSISLSLSELIVLIALIGIAFITRKSFIFGASIALIPALNSTILLAFTGVLLALERGVKFNLYALPLIFLLFIWLLTDVFIEFDYNYFSSITELSRVLSNSPWGWYQHCQLFFTYLVLVLLIDLINKDPSFFSIKGLFAGLLISQLLSLIQVFSGNNLIEFPNLTELWVSQGRIVSTFQDGNSFALASFLIIVLIWASREVPAKIKFPVLSLQVVLVLFSGSRSFFLVMLIFLALFLINTPKKLLIFSLSLTSLLILNTLLINYFFFYQQLLSSLPHASSRVLSSIDLINITEQFKSRFIFWHLNMEIFKDFPVYGLGFDHFRQFLPYYKNHLGIDIANWIDNTNSFYFGLASELGLTGIFCFVVYFLSYRFKDLKQTTDKISKYGLIAFLLILFSGPHVEFIEVAILLAVLAGLSLRQYNYKNKSFVYLLMLPVVLLPFLAASIEQVPRGFFFHEVYQGNLYQWGTKSGRLLIDCSNQTSYKAEVAPNLKIENHYCSYPDQQSETRQLDVTSSAYLIDCCKQQIGKSVYSYQLDSFWEPRDSAGKLTDPRLLGIKITEINGIK